MTGILKWFDEK